MLSKILKALGFLIKSTSRIIALVLIFSLGLVAGFLYVNTFVAAGSVAFERFLYDYKGMSVVKLTKTEAGLSGGTGFQVLAPSGKQFTLTNAHICNMAPELVAHTQNGKTQKLKVLEIDKIHDLCIMEPVEDLRPLKVAGKLFHRERVWLIGHPALRPLTLESGHYVGMLSIQLFTDCASGIQITEPINFTYIRERRYCTRQFSSQHINNIAYGGNSGSPVLDMFGNVVGVLYAGRRDQATASHSVPLVDIKRFLANK